MARTLVDIDDDALAAAAKVLKTSTKKDTINTALREIAMRDVRARMLDRFADDPQYWEQQQKARERVWRRDDVE
ncbi:type II toxin-antitoxin system VapB family antitoxin [Mycobacterium sp. pUA109]|uniref:type II toxin-antitoxin system VapB family antitoxin n=1 Tax=Mycobacterium sp. pUA109 TaxID=3238982 RepID=UPI00351B2190